MRKVIFLCCILLAISMPLLSRGATQESVTVGPQGVSVEINKNPPSPVIIDRRPVVVERPVIVVKQPVVEKTVVQQAPGKSGCTCSMATDATPLSGIWAIGALLAFGLGSSALRKIRGI